jgi:hypothetical protein
MKQHVPIVRITTPPPDENGRVQGIYQRVEVDGREWAVSSYRVDAAATDIQRVTLTFLAELTIEQEAVG